MGRLVVQVATLVDHVHRRQAFLQRCSVVLACHRRVLIGCAEVVQDAAEVARLAVAAQHLCHVARRHDDVLHLVHIAVLAGDVALDDAVVEDVGHALLVGCAREDGKVTLVAVGGDAVVQHVLTREVHHHRARGIAHQVHAALVAVLVPVDIVLGHQRLVRDELDAVGSTQLRLVLHGHALRHRTLGATRVTHVRQHVDKQRVVEHR